MAANTTSTSRKKASKKVSKKQYTQDELDEMLREAEERGAKSKQKELEEQRMREDFDEEAVFSHPLLNGHDLDEEEETPPPEGGEVDFFDRMSQDYANRGVSIKYKVKKDGQFLGDMYHPLSWSTLQESHGGGHYHVQARRSDNGQIISQCTETIMQPKKSEKDERPPVVMPQAPPQPQFDPNVLLGFVKEVQESVGRKEDREQREEKRLASETSKMQMEILMTMQKSNQDQFLKQHEMTASLISKMQESTLKLIEKMEEKTEKRMEQLAKSMENGKKENLSSLELFEMMRKSEEAGIARMREIQEMIDAKADERAASGGEESGSMSKLITAIVPVIQMATSRAGQQQMIMQQQQVAHPRRALPPQPRQTVQPAPRNAQGKTSNNQTTRNQPAGSRPQSNSPGLMSRARPVTQAQVVDLDERRDREILEKPIPVTSEMRASEKQSELEAAGFSGDMDALSNMASRATPLQEKIVTIAAPTLVTRLEDPPIEVAFDVLKMLQDQGIMADDVKENLSFNELWDLATAFGIESTHRFWFEEFYANLTTSAPNDDGENGSAEASELEDLSGKEGQS